MCRGMNLLHRHSLKLLYYGHIYSHMSYCVLVWGIMVKEELLSKIRVQQNKCVKLLCKTMHLDEIYRKYKILRLDEAIDLELKRLGYKVYYK